MENFLQCELIGLTGGLGGWSWAMGFKEGFKGFLGFLGWAGERSVSYELRLWVLLIMGFGDG